MSPVLPVEGLCHCEALCKCQVTLGQVRDVSVMAVLQQGFSLSPVVDSYPQSKHDLPRSLGLKVRDQKKVVSMINS